jgi:hypothetical protein
MYLLERKKMTSLKEITPPCATLSIKESDNLFFSELPSKVAKAKALCAECPMTQACLELGMEMEFGIFGGLTPQERKAL